MKPFTQTADTLDQELADKIDGIPVSYTHLDVYKRQRSATLIPACAAFLPAGAKQE